jgi:hypothetical protein
VLAASIIRAVNGNVNNMKKGEDSGLPLGVVRRKKGN